MTDKILEAIEEDIVNCMKCGNCQAFCPIYKETSMEGDVARGKIQLAAAVLRGEVGYSKSVEKRLSNCLMCQACSSICPCKVDCTKIIAAARNALVKKRGLPVIKRAIFELIKRPKMFGMSMRSGAVFSPIMFNSKGKARVPFGMDPKKVFPSLATTPFRNQFPEVNMASDKSKSKKQMKVLVFTGCSMNHIFPNAGKSLVEVLNANGVDVVIPKNQACCGAPVYMHGDRESAIKIAEMNVENFSKYDNDDIDYIITACGTCGEHWQHEFPKFLEGHALEDKAKALGKKIIDISAYLVNVVKIDPEQMGPVNRTVTYHDPCHLRRGMGVHTEPRELLKSIPGIKYVELKGADTCCGGAGSFSLTHFDISMDIHKRKTSAVMETGADTIVAGCGSCLMQFADGNEQSNNEFKLMHTIEVLGEAYRNKQK